jgi:hypothetical protein
VDKDEEIVIMICEDCNGIEFLVHVDGRLECSTCDKVSPYATACKATEKMN